MGRLSSPRLVTVPKVVALYQVCECALKEKILAPWALPLWVEGVMNPGNVSLPPPQYGMRYVGGQESPHPCGSTYPDQHCSEIICPWHKLGEP